MSKCIHTRGIAKKEKMCLFCQNNETLLSFRELMDVDELVKKISNITERSLQINKHTAEIKFSKGKYMIFYIIPHRGSKAHEYAEILNFKNLVDWALFINKNDNENNSVMDILISNGGNYVSVIKLL